MVDSRSMWGSRSWACVIAFGGWVLAVPILSPAEARAERLLWMSAVPEETEDALRGSLEREMQVDLLGLEEAWRLIERSAAHDPGRRQRTRIARLERRGLDAYLNLRLGDAARAFGQALRLTAGPDATIASEEDIGRLLFGRGLVHLAATRESDALEDLWLAQRMRPRFRPDPREYGPPILRAMARARQLDRSARQVRLEVDCVPVDASVLVDGRPVASGEGIALASGRRHLLLASRVGYAPEIRWLDVPADGPAREVVVLRKLEGPALAAQIVALREGRQTSTDAPSARLRDALVRALGASGSIEASSEEASIRLVHRNAQGSTQREAVGSRVSWEAEPYTMLAASLAGRVLEPPAPSAVALTVAAPSRVALGEDIEIQTRLVDREQRVEAVVAHCDELRAREPASEVVSLVLSAPEEPVDLRCHVRAVDQESRILARSPEIFEVAVDTVGSTPWYARWYVWGTVAVIVGAGIAAAVLLSQQEPENVLVLRGP